MAELNMLTLLPPTLNDTDALLAFEIDNRAWFEQWINARADGYYSRSAVREAIIAAIDDIDQDRAYQYLVRSGDTIVGRVNLVGVARPYFNRATLGYRIGASFAGKGLASQAVSLAMELAANDLRLSRVEAVVRPQNIGSIRVLERNGFAAFGRATRSMYFQGEWHDLVHYERHLDEPGHTPATGPARHAFGHETHAPGD
ncbi:GNAT family protein [Paraburkholderia sp. J67]|uniref:GNAT family N-acetyltransferase n=1 Tax=Paraburkholderia sp. J67 TaxID=2805435 RepID=UPI002ABE65D9|nr:GNAT family protein [Paraburkholderia sp. J67]